MDFYGIFVDLLIHFVSLGILCFISFCFVCFCFLLGQVVFYPVFFFRESKNMKLGGYGVGRHRKELEGEKNEICGGVILWTVGPAECQST